MPTVQQHPIITPVDIKGMFIRNKIIIIKKAISSWIYNTTCPFGQRIHFQAKTLEIKSVENKSLIFMKDNIGENEIAIKTSGHFLI